MENNTFFSGDDRVLDKAYDRHNSALSFVAECVDLAHLAYEQEQNYLSRIVPGVASLRRARNDINDNFWRYMRSISEPLIEQGFIREVAEDQGGDVIVFPDGLRIRVKKANRLGATSNYPTQRIRKLKRVSHRMAFFSGQTTLDRCIEEGAGLDVIYAAGDAVAEFEYIGLKFLAIVGGPMVIFEAAPQAALHKISPIAGEMVQEARARLSG